MLKSLFGKWVKIGIYGQYMFNDAQVDFFLAKAGDSLNTGGSSEGMSKKVYFFEFNKGLDLREGAFEQLMTDKGFVDSSHFIGPCLKALVCHHIQHFR
jgi:hypothetical protein